MPKIRINERVFKSAEEWEEKTGGKPETAVDVDTEAGLDDPAVPEEEEEVALGAEEEGEEEAEGGEEVEGEEDLLADLEGLEEGEVSSCSVCGSSHEGPCHNPNLAVPTVKLRVQSPFHEEVLDEGKFNKDDWSKFKPWMEEAQDLVYYAPRDKTPPLEKGMVRVRAQISQQGIGKVVRGKHKVRHWEKNMVTLHVWQPGFKVVSGDIRDPNAERMPYGEGEPDFVERTMKVDAKFIEPADDGRFVDVANWVLKKNKITDRYGSILDFNGRIIATKPMQKKYSNAGAISWDED